MVILEHLEREACVRLGVRGGPKLGTEKLLNMAAGTRRLVATTKRHGHGVYAVQMDNCEVVAKGDGV